MNVRIEIIPHDQQRYPTCGDWILDENGDLVIRVSKLSDWRYEMLVAVHEFCEVLMCKQVGITQQAVDDFDKNFEAARLPGNEDEPGNDPTAPYIKQHGIATGIESILAAELGVLWKEYEKEIYALP